MFKNTAALFALLLATTVAFGCKTEETAPAADAGTAVEGDAAAPAADAATATADAAEGETTTTEAAAPAATTTEATTTEAPEAGN